jgi:small subunit ribosomal protein S1
MKELQTEILAQIDALRDEPSQERDLSPFWPDPRYNVSASATIIKVEKEYAVVRTDDPSRPPAVLGNADVDCRKIIADMTHRFKVGDRVDGAFVGDPRKGTAKYTLVGSEEDPWPALAQKYPPGTVFTSVVRGVRDNIGSFVAVADDINGLIPEQTLTGPAPQTGAQVEVRISKLDTVNRRISLRLIRIIREPKPGLLGRRGYGTVVSAVPLRDGRGGFILLEIEDRDRPAMLLRRDMSEDLRADLDNGHVEHGEEIYVEVIRVDEARDRVHLRELPDPDETVTEAAPADEPADVATVEPTPELVAA